MGKGYKDFRQSSILYIKFFLIFYNAIVKNLIYKS